jgi:hypothetical protein
VSHKPIPRVKIAQCARPTRGARRQDQFDRLSADAMRLRLDTLLGMAVELEQWAHGADRVSLSESASQQVSLRLRQARVIREAVELLGGPKL